MNLSHYLGLKKSDLPRLISVLNGRLWLSATRTWTIACRLWAWSIQLENRLKMLRGLAPHSRLKVVVGQRQRRQIS
jgi:hypothetical protein